ncbi:MAG: hypothetical protein WKF73_00140 [Nocardioidaceae bacterium]
MGVGVADEELEGVGEAGGVAAGSLSEQAPSVIQETKPTTARAGV